MAIDMVAGMTKGQSAVRSLGGALESLYERYNSRCFVSPDPLEFVYRYERIEDREVVALIASSLAFGNVTQIRRSIARALEPLGSSPAGYLRSASAEELDTAFREFRHRWIRGEDIVQMLVGMRGAMRRYGSLSGLFYARLDDQAPNTIAALARFVGDIRGHSCGFRSCLLPSPDEGSACKRLHLFLRWMVRRDEVDPGGWSEVSPSMLVVPLDTHMFGMCRELGLTGRRHADLRAAREVTEGFRRFSPDDPVKYDFAMTRLRIRRDDDSATFLRMLGVGGASRAC